jgi:hypothetical protein
MEERLVEYIRSKIEGGNLTAYIILANLAYDMILQRKHEDEIKAYIDRLLTPLENKR